MMNELMLFTDGSVNSQTKTGYGAYLILSDQVLIGQILTDQVLNDQKIPLNDMKKLVQVKRFENTSSTQLELQILLWALQDIEPGTKVIAYTDSQNIIGLQKRRERFEKNNYRSKKNRVLNNKALYQKFFKIIDQLDFRVVKVIGHQASHKKDDIAKIFTLVDIASRNAMRKECQTNRN